MYDLLPHKRWTFWLTTWFCLTPLSPHHFYCDFYLCAKVLLNIINRKFSPFFLTPLFLVNKTTFSRVKFSSMVQMNTYISYNYFDLHTLPIFVFLFYDIRPKYISLSFDHIWQYIFCSYCIKYNFYLTFMTTYNAPLHLSP